MVSLRCLGLWSDPSATITAVAVGLESRPLTCSISALSFVTPEGFGNTLRTRPLGDRKHLGLGRWQYQFKIGPSKGIGLVFELTGWESLHLFEELGNIGPVYHQEVPVAHLWGLAGSGLSWRSKATRSIESPLDQRRLLVSAAWVTRARCTAACARGDEQG